MELGVYIHIPFCQSKCKYCDFISYSDLDLLQPAYIAALSQDIECTASSLRLAGASVSSVFVGGGTPTCLPLSLLAQLMEQIVTHLPLAMNVEFSVEANPGTLDDAKLLVLNAAGVTRVSLGAQSFDNSVLQLIGRIHDAAAIKSAVRLVRQAGIVNINLDLMHGLPGQTWESYQHSLSSAVALDIDHISAYSLIVEPNTILGTQVAANSLELPSESLDAAMFDWTHDYLTAQGYEHYEISSYAKPGKRCRHNLGYWRYLPYVGLGVAACSFDGTMRNTNIDAVADYIKRRQHNESVVIEQEHLSKSNQMSEYVFLALRTLDGICETEFYARFGVEFSAHYAQALATLLKQGLVNRTNRGLVLTRQGLRFANQVFAMFVD